MYRPYKKRVYAEGGSGVLPPLSKSSSLPPLSKRSENESPKRKPFWSFNGKSGFTATRTHEEAEQEARSRPPTRSTHSQSSRGSSRFWTFDVEKGFQAARLYEEAEKSKKINGYSTPNKPCYNSAFGLTRSSTPSGWSTPTETGTAPTAMTTPSRSIRMTNVAVPTQVTTNHSYSQPYQSNNQKINEQRMLKRQIEQQVQHKLQSPRQHSVKAGSPTTQLLRKSSAQKHDSPRRQPTRTSQVSGNYGEHQRPHSSVSNTSSPHRRVSNRSSPSQPSQTRKQQLRNKSIALKDQYPKHNKYYSDLDESESYPPPPVKSIQITTTSVSPITSPNFTGAKKKVDDTQIRSQLATMPFADLSSGENINGTTKPKAKKRIIRKRVKKNAQPSSGRREEQKRILAEKEAEIRRMEARIQELKLLREIQALEEELRMAGVQPMPNTKVPSINPISCLPSPTRVSKATFKMPQAQNQQLSTFHNKENHYPTRPPVNKTISKKPSNALRNSKTKSSPTWMTSSDAAIPNHKNSYTKSSPTSMMNSVSPPPLPPLASNNTSDEDPSFLSPKFQQMQQQLLRNLQTTSRNPHFSTQPAKKIEIRKPTTLPPKTTMTPREELLMCIKARR